MLNKRTILYFFITVLFSFPIFAQIFPSDYVSRIWTAADGLPGNTITDVIQSDDGYMYFGTYDGLVKFDGVKFTILNKNTLPNLNCVSARVVYEDSNGNLWVGSNDEGVAKIAQDGITMYTVESGLPNNSIRDIIEDKNGNIWVGTASGVACITYDGFVYRPEGLEAENDANCLVICMYCDTAGRVWLATAKTGGIYYYSAGRFNRYTMLDRLGKINVSAITQEKGGNLIFGIAEHGAVVVHNNDVILLDKSGFISDKTVNDIYRDSANSLWFGTEKGVYLLRDGRFIRYSVEEGLTNNSVNHILEDREGNLWFGTDHGGVEKMSMGKFQTTTLPTGVNAIAQSNENTVWIGSDDGLYCFVNDRMVENELTKLTKGIRIRHVGVANNGDLLVSCYSDLGQLRVSSDGKISKWTTANGLVGNKIRVAVEDSKNNLWVGTTTGLSVIYPDGRIRNYTKAQGVDNDYIMCIYEDDQGLVWLGTDGGGVFVLRDGDIIYKFNSQDGLAGNVIFKIMQDSKKVYWICTGAGISRFDGNSFFNYTAAEGLGIDGVFQMLIDYSDNVWMTSNRGISAVKMDDLDALYEGRIKLLDPKFFTRNDGLKSGGVTSTSLSMCDNLGRIYFTLIDGFAIYDPIKALSNKILPNVHIESFVVDDVTHNVSDNDSIVFAPGVKRIDINFTGLSYISTELIRFKHKLENFDKEYSDLSSARTVSYTNLKPGTYTFCVMASNSDGLWSEMPAIVSFRIKPFLYQMPAFWIIIVILVIGLAFAAFKIHDNRQKAIQLQLETMVQMKTVDLEVEKDMSDRLLKNILPDKIAIRLKENQFGDQTIAEKFDEASVLFADIVGFTTITSNQSADDIVSALNNLFSRFDVRAKKMGIEKIKTIGDAYMAVSGLPEPNKNHASIMLDFARGMYKDLADYNKTAKIPFKIRIGINCGPVVAGVIGKTKFIYDLWGDTVNVASRMETLCVPGHIMVTDSVRAKTISKIKISGENEYDVKGKGKMKAFTVDVQ